MSATCSLRPWKQACLKRYRLRLRQPLQLGSQQIYYREGLYLHLGFDDGRHGLGEIAPLPYFSQESLDQAQLQISEYLQGRCQQGLYPSVAFGLSCALRGQASPPAELVDYPLFTDYKSLNETQLQRLNHSPIAKCKVGRRPAEKELCDLGELLKRFPRLQLRLDANQAWSWQQASDFLARLPLQRIDYIEEPLADTQRLPDLAERFSVGLALDESVQVSDYVFRPFKGLKALVLKPSLIGGIPKLERLIKQAHKASVACVISSAYESQIGIAWLSHLAQQFTPEQSAGIDTLNIFASEQAETLWQKQFN